MQQDGAIANLPICATRLRVMLYTNDAIFFANPVRQEIDAIMQLLEGFGDGTGLRDNPQKSSAAAQNCTNAYLIDVHQNFGGTRTGFPIRYLGLPLCIGRLRLVHIQYLLDRIRARLAAWKGRLLPIAGRRVLVRCVLSAFAMAATHPQEILQGCRQGATLVFVGTRRGGHRR